MLPQTMFKFAKPSYTISSSERTKLSTKEQVIWFSSCKSNFDILSTPDNPNLGGKLKNVQVIGSSKIIAGSKEKKQFLLHSEHFNHS